MNCTVCELYLKKAVIENTETSQTNINTDN